MELLRWVSFSSMHLPGSQIVREKNMKYRTIVAGVAVVLLAGVTAMAAAGPEAPGKFDLTLDTSHAPELKNRAETKLKPAVDM